MRFLSVLIIILTISFISPDAYSGKEIDWSKSISMGVKARPEPNSTIFNEREIQIKSIGITNDKENLYIRLTVDTDIEKGANFTEQKDNEPRFKADEILFTNIWFDTKPGGEENDYHKELNGIDYHLMIDQRPSGTKIGENRYKGIFYLTLSKYDVEGWQQMWETNTDGGSGRASVKGRVLEFFIPLKDIEAGKNLKVKHSNSTMVFDPKYYVEVDYKQR